MHWSGFIAGLTCNAGLAAENSKHCPHISYYPMEDVDGYTRCSTIGEFTTSNVFTEFELDGFKSFAKTKVGFKTRSIENGNIDDINDGSNDQSMSMIVPTGSSNCFETNDDSCLRGIYDSPATGGMYIVVRCTTSSRKTGSSFTSFGSEIVQKAKRQKS